MRYVTARKRTRAEWNDEHPMLEGQTVHEPEPVDTGLVDKYENAIYRVPGPIGFVELRERS